MVPGPVTNLVIIPQSYLSKNVSHYKTVHGTPPFSGKVESTSLVVGDPTMHLRTLCTEEEQRFSFSARALDKQLAELKVRSRVNYFWVTFSTMYGNYGQRV